MTIPGRIGIVLRDALRGEAMARFEEYFSAGADLVLCYPVSALEPFSSVLRTVLAAAPSPAVER